MSMSDPSWKADTGKGQSSGPEQGWITGDVWFKKAHDISKADHDRVFPAGVDASVHRIDQFEACFADAGSLDRVTGAVILPTPIIGDNEVDLEGFSCFNGMPIDNDVYFLGFSTTEYDPRVSGGIKVSLTMGGTITTDNVSNDHFSTGDFVAWRLPKLIGTNQTDAPFVRRDARHKRLRAIYYPVRDTNPGASQRIMMMALRTIKDELHSKLKHGGDVKPHVALLDMLKQHDDQSELHKHLTDVVSGAASLHAEDTATTFACDLWSLLSWFRRNQGDTAAAFQEQHFATAAIGYLAIQAVLQLALSDQRGGREDLNYGSGNVRESSEQRPHQVQIAGGPENKQLTAVSLATNSLMHLLRFADFFSNIMNGTARHRIIGICLKGCPPRAEMGLRIDIGRKR